MAKHWWKECKYCEYFSYIKTKKYDCCDVALYKCDITGEVYDQFHIPEEKVCDKFCCQDWVSG